MSRALPYGVDVNEDLIALLSSHWLTARRDDRIVRTLPPVLVRALDELERRNPVCQCLAARDSAGARHDLQCRAYRERLKGGT